MKWLLIALVGSAAGILYYAKSKTFVFTAAWWNTPEVQSAANKIKAAMTQDELTVTAENKIDSTLFPQYTHSYLNKSELSAIVSNLRGRGYTNTAQLFENQQTG